MLAGDAGAPSAAGKGAPHCRHSMGSWVVQWDLTWKEVEKSTTECRLCFSKLLLMRGKAQAPKGVANNGCPYMAVLWM